MAVSCTSLPANALSKSEVLQLSYEQVKGSGLANRCSEVKGEGTINIAPGKKLQVTDLCVEPTSWQVGMLECSVLDASVQNKQQFCF